jgi:hypothetical protein
MKREEGDPELPIKTIIDKLKASFESDPESKKMFLQYCLLFVISASPGWSNNLLPIF